MGVIVLFIVSQHPFFVFLVAAFKMFKFVSNPSSERNSFTCLFVGILAGYENNIRGCVKNTKYPPNAEIWQTQWQPLHSICVNYCQIIVKDNNLHMCWRQKPPFVGWLENKKEGGAGQIVIKCCQSHSPGDIFLIKN